MSKKFIGIKRLWYADPITSIAGTSLTGAEIKTLLAKETTHCCPVKGRLISLYPFINRTYRGFCFFSI